MDSGLWMKSYGVTIDMKNLFACTLYIHLKQHHFMLRIFRASYLNLGL